MLKYVWENLCCTREKYNCQNGVQGEADDVHDYIIQWKGHMSTWYLWNLIQWLHAKIYSRETMLYSWEVKYKSRWNTGWGRRRTWLHMSTWCLWNPFQWLHVKIGKPCCTAEKLSTSQDGVQGEEDDIRRAWLHQSRKMKHWHLVFMECYSVATCWTFLGETMLNSWEVKSCTHGVQGVEDDISIWGTWLHQQHIRSHYIMDFSWYELKLLH